MINFNKSVLRSVRIGKRFFIIFFCLSFVPMLVMGVNVYRRTTQIVASKMDENISGINRGIQGQYNFIYKGIDDYTVELAYNNQLQELLKVYTNKSLDSREDYATSMKIVDYLKSNIMLSQEGIIKVGIRLYTGKSMNYDIDYNNYLKASSKDFISEGLYDQAVDAKGKLVWTSLVEKDHHNLFGYKDTHMAFQVTRAIRLTKGKGQTVGVLSIIYSPKILRQVYQEQMYQGDIYVVDERGYILYSNKEDILFEQIPFYESMEVLKKGLIDNSQVAIDNNKESGIVKTYSQTKDNGWGVIYTTSYSRFTSEIKEISLWLLKTAIVLIMIASIATWFFSKTITDPLHGLIQATEKVADGNYQSIEVVNSKDEVSQLAHAFNQMVYRIDDLIHQVYETRIREKDAKLRALQGQINPHFLYNTLDSMRWSARRQGNVDISHQLQILSNLFRLILKDEGITTSFRNEIKYTEYYLFFMQSTYKSQLEVVWNIDEKILEYKVIKLLLQPLVENAIKHGMISGQVLQITINIGREKNKIYVSIEDNGSGFSVENLNIQTSKSKDKRHIGLSNIRERVNECFEDSCQFELESVVGTGTKIKVTLPAILEEEIDA